MMILISFNLLITLHRISVNFLRTKDGLMLGSIFIIPNLILYVNRFFKKY